LFFCFLPVVYAEHSSFVLSSPGASISVELKGLVEGLTVGSEVVIKNATGITFTSLIAKTNCGCLKPVDVDGSELRTSEELSMKFAFLPSADAFRQTCVISGIDKSNGNRIDLLTIGFKGDVTQPVKFERTSILPDELKAGKFTTRIQSVPGVVVDYAKIQPLSDLLIVDADERSGQVRFSWDTKPEDREVKVRIPLIYRDKKYDYFITMNFVEELVTIAPSQLFFSWRNKEEEYVARCVLKTAGLDSSVSDIRIEPVVIRDGVEELKQGLITATYRQASTNSLIVECRVSKAHSLILREGFVYFSVKGFRSKPVRCSFD
jgi:hypothetical protein